MRSHMPKVVAVITLLLLTSVLALAPTYANKEPPLPGEHLMGPATVATMSVTLEDPLSETMACGIVGMYADTITVLIDGNKAGQLLSVSKEYAQEDFCDVPFRSALATMTVEDLENLRLDNYFNQNLGGGAHIVNTVVSFTNYVRAVVADVVIMLVVQK